MSLLQHKTYKCNLSRQDTSVNHFPLSEWKCYICNFRFLKVEIKVECIQYFFHQYRNLRAFVSSTHLPDSSARGSLCHDVLVEREDRQASQVLKFPIVDSWFSNPVHNFTEKHSLCNVSLALSLAFRSAQCH